MKKLKLIPIVATLMLGCLLTIKADYLDPEKQEKINQIVDSLNTCGAFVGMSLSVIHKGETVFTNGYGVIDRLDNDPVTPQTLFGIASITKQFTATLLGMILKENGLTWDTTVREVLGESFFAYDGQRTSQLTMKDLAAHRTGQPSKDMLGWKEDITREELARRYRFLDPVDQFRNRWMYNNNNYDLMAYVTEVLAGQPWEDLMTQRIFEPLNMTSTTFMHKTDLTRKDIAKPYNKHSLLAPLERVDDSVTRSWTRTAGPGAIGTSAEDMTKWMIMQLNKGVVNGVRVIPEDVIEATRTGYANSPSNDYLYMRPVIPVDYYTPQYGLGLYRGTYRGYHLINHAGVITGYASRVTMLTDMDIGVFSVLNGIDLTTFGSTLLHAYIMDIVLDVEPWLNTVTICTFPFPWIDLPEIPRMDTHAGHQTFPVPPLKLKEKGWTPDELDLYIGDYGDFYYGNMTVYANSTTSQLMMKYESMEPWTLESTEEENVFYGQPARNYLWPLDNVVFSRSDENQEKFDTLLVQRDWVPSIFVRGRKMSDAPPPPDPNNCS